MKALIAQTKDYHDLPLTAMQESMKKAYNASLTKASDYALEVATARGKTPAALRRHTVGGTSWRSRGSPIWRVPPSLRRMRGRQRRLSTLSETLGCGKLSLRRMTAR
jgi:hypothetical protein